MLKTQKHDVVAELTDKLRDSESLIVADYRGLTNKQLLDVRAKLREHGASFTVVKNTLTRRAAEAAGADELLELLGGPTAIAFVQAAGDPVAVAKTLSDAARTTRILTLRGGVLSGRAIGATDVEELAKLPPLDILKGQVVGAIVAPLNQLVGLLNAPVQDLVGLIDARIDQLAAEGGGATGAPAAAVAEAPAVDEQAEEEPAPDPPAAEADGDAAETAPTQDETETAE